MKFSEFDQERWDELHPYLDTVLLPLSGLSGNEPPWKAKEKLLKAGEVLEWIEIPFKGRTVTYPAFHYAVNHKSYKEHLEQICKGFKQCGFQFVIIVTAEPLPFSCPESADLVISRYDGEEMNTKSNVAKQIQMLWDRTSVE